MMLPHKSTCAYHMAQACYTSFVQQDTLLIKSNKSACMASALIKEIDSAQQFFSARRSDEPGAAQMTKNFANGLIQQINSCLSMTLPDATSLMHALKESPYDDTDLKRIEKTIDAKVMMLKPSTSATVKDQILRNWNDWCSQADHEVFDDPKTPWRAKVTRLVERANSVGCSRPAEETLRWMLAFLLMKHYMEIPNATEIHHKVHELKQVVLCERKTFPYEQLIVFSGNPLELPEDIWSYAYGDGEPISVTMLGLKTIADKQVAMRSNSKLLKKGALPPANVNKIEQEQEASPRAEEAAQPIAGASTDMPEPGDPVEQQLYTKYKCDLWAHRAHRGSLCTHASMKCFSNHPAQSSMRLHSTMLQALFHLSLRLMAHWSFIADAQEC